MEERLRRRIERDVRLWRGAHRDAQLWARVLAAEPAGVPEHDARAIVRRQQATVRTRHTWRVLRSGDAADATRRHASTMARAYRAFAEATGCRVIVDSAKMPGRIRAPPHVAGVRPLYLHLVRDPRATAHSWASQKAYIHSMPTWRSTAYWVGFNLASEAVVQRHRAESLFLRYEDFIREPAATIDALLRLCGESTSRNPVRGRTVSLRTNHTVTGNPDRFRTGDTEIRPTDDAWREQLPLARHRGGERVVAAARAVRVRLRRPREARDARAGDALRAMDLGLENRVALVAGIERVRPLSPRSSSGKGRASRSRRVIQRSWREPSATCAPSVAGWSPPRGST